MHVSIFNLLNWFRKLLNRILSNNTWLSILSFWRTSNKIFYNIVKVTVSHVPFIIQSFLNHTDGWSTLFLTSMKSSFYTGIHITRIFSNFATDSFHHIHLRSEKLGVFFKPEVIQTYLRKWKNLVCTSFVIICGYLVIRGKSEET